MERSPLNRGVHNAIMFFIYTALAFLMNDVVDDDAELKFKQEAHRLNLPWANEADFFITRLRDRSTWPAAAVCQLAR